MRCDMLLYSYSNPLCLQFYVMDGLDANLNREKLKTTLVPMPHILFPHQPASWISRHSQDGGKVVKQEIF